MKKFSSLLISFTCTVLMTYNAQAQCNFIADDCAPNIVPFVSDGQSRRALVEEGDTVEFFVTFYANNDYRIQACPGLVLDHIYWSVWDTEKHLLFENLKHSNTNQWDFHFTGTVNTLIRACLPKGSELGCLVMLVGFKD